MQTRKNLITVVALGLVVLVGLIFWLNKDSANTVDVSNDIVRGVTGDPRDIALDFYDQWKDARLSTSTDPYQSGLHNSFVLSADLSKKLGDGESAFKDSVDDLVLCQSTIPEKFRMKSVYENSDSAQFLVSPKENELGTQSLVSLTYQNELWVIKDITCSAGDVAPEQGEFTFDREGFLLQKSAQPPLNPADWHLVFEQDGVLGYFVPIFLSESSVCISEAGDEETCQENMLGEALKVKVQGSMTEAGVDVKRLQFIK
jgi:hypothetical protein